MVLESENFRVELYDSQSLTKEKLTEFRDFVSQGNTILNGNVRISVIRYAAMLYSKSLDTLVSARCLKLPSSNYKNSVFTAAKIPQFQSYYTWESGYSFTHPDFRGCGFSTNLLSMLKLHAPHGKIYATCKMKNEAIIKVFLKENARPIGRPFISEGNELIMLWRIR